MKITVIIPVYNTEMHLNECIQSVLDQAFTDFELLLVNDGSTDQSGVICDEFASKDARIRVIHILNSGVSVARNIGLNEMNGEYVTFLDSDDYLSPETLFCNLEKLISSNSDIIQFPAIKFSGNKQKKVKDLNFLSEESRDREKRLSSQILLIDLWIQKKLITNYVCNKLYHKSIWNDLRFPVGMRYEDRFVMSDILLRCKAFYISSCGSYNYRQHEDQLVQRNRDYFIVSSMLKANMNTIKNTYSLLSQMSSSFLLVFWDSISLYKELKMLDKNKAKKEFQSKLNSFKVNPIMIEKSNIPLGIKLRMIMYFFVGIK